MKWLMAFVLTLLLAGSAHAQTAVYSYTLTWAPTPGSIGLNFIDAPGSPQANGDLNSGTATVGIPLDGMCHELLVTLAPTGATMNFVTIQFCGADQPLVMDAPKYVPNAPTGIQVY